MNSESRVVMAVMAHPDDAEITMGGTLAAYAKAGAKVVIVVCSIPSERERRIAEATRSAEILGAQVEFLDAGRPEWQVEDLPVYRLTALVDAAFRKHEPQVVFTHWVGDAHHDHVTVGQAVLGSSRHKQRDVFMVEQPNLSAANVDAMKCNTYVDVSEHLEACLASIRVHISQVSGRPYVEMVEARARYHGTHAGCRYAEAFQCVRQRLEP
jgi:LmbE family N-acetylglucosaminyl deacetylase